MNNIKSLLESAKNKGYKPFNDNWDYNYAPETIHIELANLQKWLRDKHELHITIDNFLTMEDNIDWDYSVSKIGADVDERGGWIPLIDYDTNRTFITYELALQGGITEALKLIQI